MPDPVVPESAACSQHYDYRLGFMPWRKPTLLTVRTSAPSSLPSSSLPRTRLIRKQGPQLRADGGGKLFGLGCRGQGKRGRGPSIGRWTDPACGLVGGPPSAREWHRGLPSRVHTLHGPRGPSHFPTPVGG